MFDLAKIALALDAAEKIGTNSTVQMLSADARDEFVKLREAIESGVIVAMCETGLLHALGVTRADKPKLHALNNCDHVLLVKCDD